MGFYYHEGELHAEALPMRILAERYGTPLYVYSKEIIIDNYLRYTRSEKPCKICYAVKANANLSILKLLADMGAGFDVVSIGELERVLMAGGNPREVVFSGVGKRLDEIQAAIVSDIFCFNVESEKELYRIQQEAYKLDLIANIAVRVNPHIDANTHTYIATGLENSKFGISWDNALDVYKKAAVLPNISVIGIASHIGSQILDYKPLLESIDRLLDLVEQLNCIGIALQHIDIGGGLGVSYRDEIEPSIEEYLAEVNKKLVGTSLETVIEPGRSIVAHAGVLLTKVELIKESENKSFAVVDTSMTENIRPVLYGAWHDIETVVIDSYLSGKKKYDVVGSVCESSDCLGKDRMLSLKEGDLLAVRDVGAYGFVMASNYNCRNRPAEILVEGNQSRLIRRRETIADQMQCETQYLLGEE